MNDELIQQIVRQILAEPMILSILQGKGNITIPDTPSKKQDSLVLLNYTRDLESILIRLNTRWGNSHNLHLLPSDSMLRLSPDLPNGQKWITPQDAFCRDWCSILVPACSLNTLAKLALGIRDNPFTELLGRGIAQGIYIELVTEFFGFTDQTSSAYKNLYAEYLEKVQSFGVTVSPCLDNQSCSQIYQSPLNSRNDESLANQDRQRSQQTQNIVRFTKKYLSDKDAYSFPEDSRVLIPQRVIISPLARDTMRMRRIELCQEREEQRQCY